MTTHKGEDFIFDLEDLERVSKSSWCISKTGYLVARINKKNTKLHRYILDLDNPKEVVDHINGNPMDNRKENLRICSNVQNTRNNKISKNNSTGYPGIRVMPSGRFRARIMVDRKEISLGTYDTFEEAKQARIKGELKYFGEFAPSLNVIE
ncbi:HNH endonuclease [Lysinibacillus sp. NPDC097195]|uniref:HNH endonuclease n=1 Tax=Lysinibacillus sp. NPDC097195 TaxID=3364141 RepID=UPI0038124977